MSLCSADNSQLVIIDIQERLGAVMPGKVINRVINNSILLLRVAGLFGVPVTCTDHYPDGLGGTLEQVPALVPPEAPRIEKTCFASTRSEAFMEALGAAPERNQVVLCGMEAHVCVLQTAIELRAGGHEVMVVEDAVCSRKLENYQNALERLRQADVTVVSAESVMFEWLADSRHEHFRAVSALIR